MYKYPELLHTVSISWYHDIPHHINYFVYQVWVLCPLCEERHWWLVCAMTLTILVVTYGAKRIQIYHTIIYSTTIHINRLLNKLVSSHPNLLSTYILCATILHLKALDMHDLLPMQ